jgi:hypothetical protein
MATATLEVRIDATRPLALLRNGGRRMAYALVNALNNTAKNIQKTEREQVRSKLTVRKRDFILRQIAIIDFASAPRRLYQARIRIGQKDRLLLSDLEAGGIRKPFGPGRRVAVPLTGGAARPSFAQPVSATLRVTALRLIKVRAGQPLKTRKGRSKREQASVAFRTHETGTGKTQIKGTHRTFVLEHTAKAPEGGIYQRVGPGRDDIRLIYPFVTGPKLAAMLRWLITAEGVARRELEPELGRQVRMVFGRALGLSFGG